MLSCRRPRRLNSLASVTDPLFTPPTGPHGQRATVTPFRFPLPLTAATPFHTNTTNALFANHTSCSFTPQRRHILSYIHLLHLHHQLLALVFTSLDCKDYIFLEPLGIGAVRGSLLSLVVVVLGAPEIGYRTASY